ncbi:MAG TPA: ATPase, T2SS/T4P/T4SS family [Thermoleophilaceae bacterium]|nr:ATPase, T2SS/T4P/T4SS family [Thermoleophilaceae bacterium]
MSDVQVASAGTPSVPGLIPPSERTGAKRRIGDVIVQLGFTDRDVVEASVERARERGLPVGQVLVEDGVVNSSQLARALAERNGLDYVDLNEFAVDHGAAHLIDASKARRHRTVPIAFAGDRTLLVATADPANVVALDDITMATGYEVRRAVASAEDIESVIGQLSRLDESVQELDEAEEQDAAQVIELRESADDAPVVKLVHTVIADAVSRGASDIHFEPRNADMRVRFRIDGVVSDSTTVPRHLVPGLVSRVKIMSDLDIAERRAPQDGRVGMTVDGRRIDLRVATLPVMRGEAVVMRILDQGQSLTAIEALGLGDDDRSRFEQALLGRTHGAILVTGPTGSGKTTTLYAGLGALNTPEKTIVTIEDPVEFELEGIKQIQVNPKAGLTFPAGLRSMVRADPDVIMVGEIRDHETALIAIESALTGHLVLSTLHTNDAPMAAARLIEMGIEPFLVASGLECVVAQRLVRRLCDCKVEVKLSKEVLASNGFDPKYAPLKAFEPGKCVRCGGTGYRGRIGVYQVMRVSDKVSNLILEKSAPEAITEAGRAEGMGTLRDDGFEKVRQGITSVAEVLRVAGT